MHLVRHPEEQVGYIGVKDSSSFQQFGQQQMATPGIKSMLESQIFIDLMLEEVLQRKTTVRPVRTLAGIMSKFQYICEPSGKVM